MLYALLLGFLVYRRLNFTKIVDQHNLTVLLGQEANAGNNRFETATCGNLLNTDVEKVFPTVPDGVCPLFFPVIVPDKHAAAELLRARGVDALEFWNDSAEPGGHEMGPDAQFLRRHVLELPIHQDLTLRHVDHIARQVHALGFRVAA